MPVSKKAKQSETSQEIWTIVMRNGKPKKHKQNKASEKGETKSQIAYILI